MEKENLMEQEDYDVEPDYADALLGLDVDPEKALIDIDPLGCNAIIGPGNPYL